MTDAGLEALRERVGTIEAEYARSEHVEHRLDALEEAGHALGSDVAETVERIRKRLAALERRASGDDAGRSKSADDLRAEDAEWEVTQLRGHLEGERGRRGAERLRRVEAETALAEAVRERDKAREQAMLASVPPNTSIAEDRLRDERDAARNAYHIAERERDRLLDAGKAYFEAMDARADDEMTCQMMLRVALTEVRRERSG